jgi:hypothetical protein
MRQEMSPEMSLLERMNMHMAPSESAAVASACYSICIEVYSQVQQTLLHPECRETIKPDQLDVCIEQTFIRFIQDPDVFKGLKTILKSVKQVEKFRKRKGNQSKKVLKIARSIDSNLPESTRDYEDYDPDNLPPDEILHESLIQFAHQYIEELHAHDRDQEIFYKAQHANIHILTEADIPAMRQMYNANLISTTDLIDDPQKLQQQVGLNGGFLRSFDECPEYAHAVRHPIENDRISINIGATGPTGSLDAWFETTIFKQNMTSQSKQARASELKDYFANTKHGRVNPLEVHEASIAKMLDQWPQLIFIGMILRNKASGMPRHIIERVTAIVLHAIASYNEEILESGFIETYRLEGLHIMDAHDGLKFDVAGSNEASNRVLTRLLHWRPYAEFVDSSDPVTRVIKNITHKIFATWIHGVASAPKAIRTSIEIAQSARRMRGLHEPDPAFAKMAEAVQELASESE